MLKEIKKGYEEIGLVKIYHFIYNDAFSRMMILDGGRFADTNETLMEMYTKMMLYKIKLKNITEGKDNSKDKNKRKEIAEKLLNYYEAFNSKIELPIYQERIAKHFKAIELQYAETNLNLK